MPYCLLLCALMVGCAAGVPSSPGLRTDANINDTARSEAGTDDTGSDAGDATTLDAATDSLVDASRLDTAILDTAILDTAADTSIDATPDVVVDARVDAGGPTTLCQVVDENQTMTLTCPAGYTIELIDFVSYGTPTGSCGGTAFRVGTCHYSTSQTVIATRCAHRETCSIPANNATFGDPCSGTNKRLAVQVRCLP